MKEFNECLFCKTKTKNRKYCSKKCNDKYYYNNKPGVKEKKINSVLEKRKNIYYVYGFYYKKNDMPFYIGKGSGDRYKQIGRGGGGRSKKFIEVIDNNEYYSKIIYDNLYEDIALEIESRLINDTEGLVNVVGRVKTEKRKCPLCKRDDVEFYENVAARRCKDCTREGYKQKREEKERNERNVMLEFLEKGELSIINLFNLINNK